MYFCIFSEATAASKVASGGCGGGGGDSAATRPSETVLVLKFCANRLAAQSEYFAYEIAKSLGVDAPATRLIRKAPPGGGSGSGAVGAGAGGGVGARMHDFHTTLHIHIPVTFTKAALMPLFHHSSPFSLWLYL